MDERCPLCGGDLASAGLIRFGTFAVCGSCVTMLPERLATRQAAGPSTLALATVAELIEELMQRSTFRGLCIWQAESFKGPNDNRWRWRSVNCNPVAVMFETAEILSREPE